MLSALQSIDAINSIKVLLDQNRLSSPSRFRVLRDLLLLDQVYSVSYGTVVLSSTETIETIRWNGTRLHLILFG
ncbi:hypothetical protein L6452_17075 [Arctium lappa]|uniref:Uncharacterized protein n=1 Tax=Arctium lappa TaxID=4217 RepID=A0ACB9C2G3_ARCLA|nr:hypothetical protein L6452_17075 [Arctium lappa]